MNGKLKKKLECMIFVSERINIILIMSKQHISKLKRLVFVFTKFAEQFKRTIGVQIRILMATKTMEQEF